MGPTNVALVRLFEADQALRGAEARLESASRNVRVQERRIADLNERLKLIHSQLREQQARTAEFELDLKSRDAKIERLRQQQQNANNLKEYQAFLTEINTEKIDRNKVEEETLKLMGGVEKIQAEMKDLTAQLEGDQKKLTQMREQLGGQLAALQNEVDRLRPLRDTVAASVPPRALDMFERLAERFEGEAMASLGKPDRRREEYICNACNMSLVADIYNRLHSRDEPVVCPNCRRLLYIPDDLPPEAAINLRPQKKAQQKDSADEASEGAAAT